MKDFKNLRVWQKSHLLAVEVYRCTEVFPRSEMYGLTSQVCRSTCSIAANIAEGCGRKSDSELARFLQIARGSASELECHLLLARDLQMLDGEKFVALSRKLLEVTKNADQLGSTCEKRC